MKGKRFDITETEGGVKGLYMIVDKETGVNYLMAKFGITGELCPLTSSLRYIFSSFLRSQFAIF